MDRRAAKAQLKKLLNILDEIDIPYEEVIVFGSFARGMATAKSDLDLCIIFPTRQRDDVDYYLTRVSFAAGRANLQVDITGTTRKAYRTNKISPFLNEVRKHGISASDFLH